MKAAVMVNAWQIAKEGAVKFGGKAVQYIAGALRQAWATAKAILSTPLVEANAMKISKWTTARGAQIEMHTEHVTEEPWFTDDWGVKHTKKVDHIKIAKFIVNGEERFFNGCIRRVTVQDTQCIHFGDQRINGKNTHLYAPIPSDIEQDVWGEWDARLAAKTEREKKATLAHQNELRIKIANGYCTKCGSYCYGDCEA